MKQVSPVSSESGKKPEVKAEPKAEEKKPEPKAEPAVETKTEPKPEPKSHSVGKVKDKKTEPEVKVGTADAAF